MNRRLSAIALAVVPLAVLAGCSSVALPIPTADPGDQKACEVWSKAEQAMLSTVSAVTKLAETNDVTQVSVDLFNEARNTLVAAYGNAAKAATDPDLKKALQHGVETDGKNYFTLTNATAAQLAEGTAAVGDIVAKCALQGIDIASVLGTNAK